MGAGLASSYLPTYHLPTVTFTTPTHLLSPTTPAPFPRPHSCMPAPPHVFRASYVPTMCGIQSCPAPRGDLARCENHPLELMPFRDLTPRCPR